uniref:Vacuolar protein sorting-associated protein 54 C-terminal domain-containing protein n=1 Tax=Ciona savignyi TaxID=51511 RepID=H2ZNG2_CIOSA
EKWTFHQAKVNLAALLNDPRKLRRDYDLFTKTWGETFRDLPQGSTIYRSKYIPNVVRAHFQDYLDNTGDQYLRHESKSLDHLEGSKEDDDLRLLSNVSMKSAVNAQQERDAILKTRAALDALPKIYLRKDFSMMDPKLFSSVMSNSNEATRSQTNQRKAISSSKLLQEKLSHYLDMVEVAIVRQISVQSEAFFQAIANIQHDSQEYLNATLKSTQMLLSMLKDIRSNIVNSSLQVVRLQMQHTNAVALLQKLQMMVTVHQTQPTIQLLLSTDEYAGALDLIRTTHDVLHQELAGIRCFRHLSSQLTEMERVIGQMMQQEMQECFSNEIQRPISEGISCVQPHRVTAVTLGLLRQGQFDFLDSFRLDTVRGSFIYRYCNFMKRIIKELVCEAVFDVPEVDSTLASKMRVLNFHAWLVMLNRIFDNLIVLLRKSAAMLWCTKTINLGPNSAATTMYEGAGNPFADSLVAFDDATNPFLYSEENHDDGNPFIGDEMENLASYEDELINSAADVCSSPTVQQTPTIQLSDKESDIEQYENISRTLRSVLCCACAFQQDRWVLCVRPVDIMLWSHHCNAHLLRCVEDSSLDKLSSGDFLELAKTIKRFTSEVDSICYFVGLDKAGLNGSLRGALQAQSARFIARFHEERRNKLSLILDNEVWKQAEVPSELSSLLQNLVDGKLVTSDASSNTKTSDYLYLDGVKYAVVGTVLILLKMVSEYCKCCDDLPMSTADLVHRLRDLLTLFNSRTCQLVLGAGALQLVGLKTITTKNLSLASQCLQLVLHCIPSIRTHFESHLMKINQVNDDSSHKQNAVLRHFDHITKDYQDHIMEIENKLLAIVEGVITRHVHRWEVKAPVPSISIRNICKQISKFHETVRVLLPQEQTMGIVMRLNDQFKREIRVKLVGLGVRNDGGPQHGLVTSDLSYYENSIKVGEPTKY